MCKTASPPTRDLPRSTGMTDDAYRTRLVSERSGPLPRNVAIEHVLPESLKGAGRKLPADDSHTAARQGIHTAARHLLCGVVLCLLAACGPAKTGGTMASHATATPPHQTAAQDAMPNAPVIRPGDTAPDFDLPAVDGTRLRLTSFRGRKAVVLSFVPAAFTPVCSAQWSGYAMLKPRFEQLGAVVVGISVDNVPALAAWTREMGTDAAGHPSPLWFPVVSDFWPHGAVTMRYGLLRPDGIADRALVLIDKAGVVRLVEVSAIDRRPGLDNLFMALERMAAED